MPPHQFLPLRSKLEAFRRRGPPAEILSEAKDLFSSYILSGNFLFRSFG
jgi:hypothetical protein